MERREFLRMMAASGAVVSLRGWSCAATQSAGFKFTPDERETLGALLDALIPGGDTRGVAPSASPSVAATAEDGSLQGRRVEATWGPGVVQLGGVEYIETLLNAFAFEPPRIFAGGPFSGRSGGADLFSQFVPLSKAEELIWRTRIEGSKGIPEREFNGPVIGFQERYLNGLGEAARQAKTRYGASPSELSDKVRLELLQSLSGEFGTLLYEHAVEAMYGDPVYGGNREMGGWRSVGFEGDRQPIGYSRIQISEYDE